MKRLFSAILATAAFAAMAGQASAGPITFASTGLGAPGTVDASYQLIQAPTGVTLEAIILDPTKLATPWEAPMTAANWIGVTDDDARTGNGAMAASDPGHLDSNAGLYIFRAWFDLTDYRPETATVDGWWSADNIAEIYVNGVSTGITREGHGWSGYELSQFHLDSTNALFIKGLNAIDFHVTNLMSFHNIGNPVGLLVEGVEIDAVHAPEPGSFVLLGSGILFVGYRLRRRGRR